MLNPTKFWPSSDTLRMPSLVAEPSRYALGIGLNGMGGASVVTFANKPTMDWEHMGASSSEFLSGTIDEVQIWSQAITDKNLLSVNAALTGEAPGLITFLTLNQGPDSRVALDRSTGQNHARLMKSTGSLPEWVPSLSGNTGFASVAFGGGSRGSGRSTGTPIAAGRWSHLAAASIPSRCRR